MKLRPASPEDQDFLWRAQSHAALLEAEDDPVGTVRRHPMLARYVEGWGRAGDLGVIATPAEHAGEPIGAAWCRRFPQTAPGWGWIDTETPELSVAVLPSFRGLGLGTALLTELLRMTDAAGTALSLAVRSTNPALRLYLRLGFCILPERDFLNRTGILSHVMLRARPQPPRENGAKPPGPRR